MKAKVWMAPLAILAVTLASCGVASDPTFEGRELPAPSGTIEDGANSDTGDTGETVETVPTEPARPVGAIERTDVLVPGFVTITGWANDGVDSGPIAVTAWLDLEPVHTVLATDPSSPSAAGSTRSGFAFDVPVPAGAHTVCVTVAPHDTVPVDCVEVEGMDDTAVADTGVADTAVADDGSVLLTAVTPDADRSVTIRGVITGADAGAVSMLDVRSDVGVVTDAGNVEVDSVEVDHQAFRFDVSELEDGTWSVCADRSGISVQERRPTPAAADGCGTIVIGDLNVGTTGRTVGVRVVAPPPDHPLYLMERDAGVSVELSDGSTIWFFGDTMERRSDGSLEYFVNNTAAWAAPEAPTVTRDAVSAGGEPILFAAPPPGTCTASVYPDAALWPEAAVALPQEDGTDRVVVVMSKVCLGSTWLDIETVGYAVAEFVYDPDDPPADRPITGEVTQPDLAPADAGYGRALLLADDGQLYGYQCGMFPDTWGPCRVARVSADDITDTASWSYWNGGDWIDPASWVPERAAAAPMDLAGAAEPNTLPVAAFGVVDDDGLDAHLMVYSPWPGFCSELAVRVADTPVGPWTQPVPITLPDCTDEDAELAEHCYAATPQMQLCGPDEFGGGYFDLLTDAGVGQYLTFVTPFVVIRSER